MASTCRHRDVEELQSDKDFREMTEWTRSVTPRLVITDELRQAKIFDLRGDWDGGLGRVEPRPIQTFEYVIAQEELKSSGLWMRSAQGKVNRAQMFIVESKTKSRPKADPVALAKALKELGL